MKLKAHHKRLGHLKRKCKHIAATVAGAVIMSSAMLPGIPHAVVHAAANPSAGNAKAGATSQRNVSSNRLSNSVQLASESPNSATISPPSAEANRTNSPITTAQANANATRGNAVSDASQAGSVAKTGSGSDAIPATKTASQPTTSSERGSAPVSDASQAGNAKTGSNATPAASKPTTSSDRGSAPISDASQAGNAKTDSNASPAPTTTSQPTTSSEQGTPVSDVSQAGTVTKTDPVPIPSPASGTATTTPSQPTANPAGDGTKASDASQAGSVAKTDSNVIPAPTAPSPPTTNVDKTPVSDASQAGSATTGKPSTTTPPQQDTANPAPGAPTDFQKVVDVTATAYAAGTRDNDQWGDKTHMGTQVRPGVIAVDPNVIPLGSQVYVQYPDGHGEYLTAEDTGGAIKGNRIDIALHSDSQALDFGIQKVKVYVVNSPNK